MLSLFFSFPLCWTLIRDYMDFWSVLLWLFICYILIQRNLPDRRQCQWPQQHQLFLPFGILRWDFIKVNPPLTYIWICLQSSKLRFHTRNPAPFLLYFSSKWCCYFLFQQLIQCKSEKSVIYSGFATLNSPVLFCMGSNHFRGWRKVKTKIFLK